MSGRALRFVYKGRMLLCPWSREVGGRLLVVGLIATALGLGCGGGKDQGGGGAGGKSAPAGIGGGAGSGGAKGSIAGAGGAAGGGGSGGAAGGSGGAAGGGGAAVAGGGAGGHVAGVAGEGGRGGSGGGLGGSGGGLGGRGGDGGGAAGGAAGGPGCQHVSEVLYTNDFETPNVPLTVTCGNSLDNRGINLLYGTPTFSFTEMFTVEGVVIHDPDGRYDDPDGTGKKYAVGMQTAQQDDHLALTFAVTGRQYLNVGFDLSSIDVFGCGGPFGVAAPIMRVSLYDTPTGVFDFGAPGTLLSQGTAGGVDAPSPWTFAWTYDVVTLDATSVTGGSVTVVFDLLVSGYAAIDNLSIVSSEMPGVVDRNNNGIPDDQEGCAP
jgi:hypothetical protein